MIHHVHRSTLTEAWHEACSLMFYSTKGEISTGSSMTILYDCVLSCDSMEFEMDVWRDLHLTKSRFPVLQRTYLDPQEFDDFLVRCERVSSQKGAVTKLHAIPHKPRGINRTKKTGNYAHGGCIHGWDFRVSKETKKPQLVMHSRVSYLPYMGGLDLALCYVIAKEVGARLGFTVEDFSFVWYCSAWQYAHMQSVAYTWNHKDFMRAIKDEESYPDAEFPTIKLMRKTIRDFARKRKEGFTPEQEKFAQLMRYRRRWEERVARTDKWPNIPVSKLDLLSLRGGPFMEDDDDE